MKQGRPGYKLLSHEIDKLFHIMSIRNWNYQQMSFSIRISRYQLYNPMNNRSRCSENTYKKIQRFLSRN